MDIKRKADGWIVTDVERTDGYAQPWKQDFGDSVTYYNAEDWEPVEEWVTIQVKKSQWDEMDERALTLNSEYSHLELSWRYPPKEWWGDVREKFKKDGEIDKTLQETQDQLIKGGYIHE